MSKFIHAKSKDKKNIMLKTKTSPSRYRKNKMANRQSEWAAVKAVENRQIRRDEG